MSTNRARAGRGNANRKSAVGARRTTRSAPEPQDEASRAYGELLSEATTAPTRIGDERRPTKKRRTGPAEHQLQKQDDASQDEAPTVPATVHVQTTVEDFSASSDESDVNWEQVDFDDEPAEVEPSAADDAAARDISINLSHEKQTPSKRTASRRLPASTVEKRKRVHIHEMHLCCLLAHLHIRNSWCNDEEIQTALKPLLSEKTVSYLNPEISWSQFQRSRSFVDGLEQACDAFRGRYQIHARGMSRPSWVGAEGETEKKGSSDYDGPIDKEEFLRIAQDLSASRDVGAQLFCALLRSVGVDARVICSLQVLPFTAPVPAPSPSVKDWKRSVVFTDEIDEQSADGASGSDDGQDQRLAQEDPSQSHGLKPVKRFGGSGSAAMGLGVPPPAAVKRKPLHESPYPVYWVEAFNLAIQKWIPVDPLVTRTIAKDKKFEPPAADSRNDMSYVVAFEDDGTAKDVTRRYAKAYNAKTRKARVEATKGGEKWWRKVMRVFDSGFEADRDQVEDAELAQKEASEPMPRNVQDFKDHPYYALERHLKRNEVIHPKKEVGKLTTGSKGGSSHAAAATETIYRRRDVQALKSADKWFREGRDIKAGEQPLKHNISQSRRARNRSPSPFPDQDDEPVEDSAVGLYAEFQTSVYVPPPVVEGRIPKNAYGNLDIHVPTMIPPGAIHIRAVEAAQAARITGVDYADAVTGFKFSGRGRRRGTAVTEGVIVAAQFADAVAEVVLALRWQEETMQRQKQAKMVLAMWKRFLIGLRIRRRVMEYADDEEDLEDGNYEENEGKNIRQQVDDVLMKEEETQEQGGFLPDRTAQAAPEPRETSDGVRDAIGGDVAGESIDSQIFETRPTRSYDKRSMCIPSPWPNPDPSPEPIPSRDAVVPDVDELGGGFLSAGNEDQGSGFLAAGNGDQGGGFIRTDDVEQGGGFLPPTNEDDEDEGIFVMQANANDEVEMQGGGFVTATEDEVQGGGFIPPEQGPSQATERSGMDVERKIAHDEDPEPREASDPGPMSQLSPGYDGANDELPPRFSGEVDQDTSQSQQDAGVHAQGDSLAADKADNRAQAESTFMGEADANDKDEVSAAEIHRNDDDADGNDSDEAGSLMSHDPEDEDAEPAWLAE